MMKSPEKKTVRSSEPDSKQNLHNFGQTEEERRKEKKKKKKKKMMMMMKLPEKETH